jgi:hypothetical protein
MVIDSYQRKDSSSEFVRGQLATTTRKRPTRANYASSLGPKAFCFGEDSPTPLPKTGKSHQRFSSNAYYGDLV